MEFQLRIKRLLLYLSANRNKFLFAFIGSLAVLLIVSAVLRTFTNEKPPTSTVVGSNIRPEATIEFASINLDIPRQLSTYSSDSQTIDLVSFAAEEASKLGLTKHPTLTNLWENTALHQGLFLENNNQFITYQVFSEEHSEEQGLAQKALLSTAQSNVTKFIQEKELFTDFIVSGGDYIINNEGFVEVLDINLATAYRFTVTVKIDEFPFYPNTIDEALATVYTDTSGEVIRITFHPIRITPKKISTYSTLSMDQLQQNMKNGLITYLKADKIIPDDLEPEQLNSVTFNSASIEYRQHPQNGYILPYVRFTGTGRSYRGVEFEVEAITPAIAVE